ncbi:MAG TPA: hypothetical protein VKU79_00110, partial [Thermoplasmataceae archaeon]|nr:hypothetical protein [Thermoplasmataceae archaeon]
ILLVSLSGLSSASSQPTLSLPPSSLPTYTYYINGTSNHYTITDSEWNTFFTDIIDNKTYVTYNWSSNATQDLIIFDLSYSGLNYYGMQWVVQLSQIGSPSLANMSKAFNATKDLQSLVSSGGHYLTDIQALNAGAYPGFSWSHPRVPSMTTEYRNIGIIVVIVVSMFILYYVFNRKK